MTAQPIPILRSVFAAYAFFIAHWRPLLIAGVPYTVAYALQLALLNSVTAGGEAGPMTGLGSMVLSLATLLASLALSAAALRMAVRGDFGGWLGLRLGEDEFRVFVVTVLVAALTVLVFLLVFMFWAVVVSTIAVGAMQAAGVDPEAADTDLSGALAYIDTTGWLAITGLGLAAAAVVLWLTARLVPALPATIAQRKIQVLSVWKLSSKQAWRIALALVLTAVPMALIELGLYEIASAFAGDRFLATPVALGPEGVDAPGLARAQEYVRVKGLFAFIELPVFSGLYAYIYQTLTRPAKQAG